MDSWWGLLRRASWPSRWVSAAVALGLCHVAILSFTPRAAKDGTRVEVELIAIADTLGSTDRRRTLRFRGC